MYRDRALASNCNCAAKRGISTLEFAFVLLTLIPLLLGTGVVGINMIRTLQTIQLARDAGHMFARGVDFSQPGNQTILGNIGGSLGLSTTAGSGSAVVILSAITYVDKNLCTDAGAVDGSGNPLNCTNFNKWVFTQRLLIGNSAIRQSNIGAPSGVPINSTTGKIVLNDYVLNGGAVAQFNGINPYSVVNGEGQGLPSRQILFVAEAGAQGFSMKPFVPNAVSYSYGLF
jgi:hypothetical protein